MTTTINNTEYHTQTYAYDVMNQLIRENNQAAEKTWTWVYDNAGNIQTRAEYAYTTASLEGVTPTDTVNYTYGDDDWGDLLTAYDGQTITYDEIGNPLSDGTWTYTWEHGRELASMSDGTTTWNYTYNADGLRTTRSNGTVTYKYVYNGSSLSQMMVGSDILYFTSDTVTYNNTVYYYVKNIQGDVIAILDSAGTAVVEYSYDAWGNILTTTGELATTLGAVNPLRYRGYVYDSETGLYYLQSRYYDPEVGRFLNADAFASTGQGILGNNMFAYCGNNPVNHLDLSGNDAVALREAQGWWIGFMGWLCVVDGVLPVGEIIYFCGILILGAVALEEILDASPRIYYAEDVDQRRSLPIEGEPGSDEELYDDNGDLKQIRHYGPDGRAAYDIDYQHGGDYEFPHMHAWDWGIVPPRSGHLPMP